MRFVNFPKSRFREFEMHGEQFRFSIRYFTDDFCHWADVRCRLGSGLDDWRGIAVSIPAVAGMTRLGGGTERLSAFCCSYRYIWAKALNS